MRNAVPPVAPAAPRRAAAAPRRAAAASATRSAAVTSATRRAAATSATRRAAAGAPRPSAAAARRAAAATRRRAAAATRRRAAAATRRRAAAAAPRWRPQSPASSLQEESTDDDDDDDDDDDQSEDNGRWSRVCGIRLSVTGQQLENGGQGLAQQLPTPPLAVSPVTSSSRGHMLVGRLNRELAEILANPTDGCTVQIFEDDMTHWQATILGPTGTPYEGGQFDLDIFFRDNYPHKPPRVRFRTKIYHCNVSEDGSLCLDILAEKWSPVLTVEKILLSIMSLLADANPDDPLDLEKGQLYKSNRKKYDQNARTSTKRFAMP